MSSKTKSQLRTENNSSFPNNNSQLITPEILRTFNEDIIDSMVSNEDSGSFTVDSGSLLTTASFDNGTRDMTFTKGDGSTFNVNIPDASGSVLPSGVVSGSSQIDYPLISNIPSGIVSGSSQVSFNGISDKPTLVSGSSQINYPDISNIPSGIVSGSVVTSIIAGANITIDQSTGDVTINASGTSLPAGVVSGSSQVILQETTGNLSGSRISGPVLESVNSTSASHSEFADEVEYSGILNKPTLVSGSSQINYPDISNIPSGIVSGSDQLTGSYDARYFQLNANNTADGDNIFSGSITTADQSTILFNAQPNVANFSNTAVWQYPKYSNLDGRGIETNKAQLSLYGNNTSETFAGAVGFEFEISGSNLGGESRALFGPLSNQMVVVNGATGQQASLAMQLDNNNNANMNIGANRISFMTNPAVESAEIGNPSSTVPIYMQQQFVFANPSNGYSTPLTINIDGSLTASADISSSASIHGNQFIGGTVTASLQEGYVWVGDSSGITTTVATSSFAGGALPSGVVSGSSQLTSSYDTRYALSGSGVTSIIAGTNITIDQSTGDVTINASGGGGSTDTGSLLTTASADFSIQTFTKGDGSTFEVDVTPRQVIETVKNKEGYTLPKGTPVYASGSTGNAVHVFAASSSRADRMPAAYVLNEELTSDAEGNGLLLGFINGVDTSAFTSGDVIYVGANGGYTNQKPTGSNQIQNLGKVIVSDAVNGSGVVSGAGRSNDLPNITEGYAWVGDSNGVPQAISTASWDAHSDLTSLNAFTQSQENLNATFATTGSNSFVGNQTLTGSLTIQDTNAPMSGLTLLNGSGGGAVQILPAGDFITTFNSATLTGLNLIGANALSGSTHYVGYQSSDVRIKALQTNSTIDLGFGIGDGDYALKLYSGSDNAEFKGNITTLGNIDVTGSVTASAFSGSLDYSYLTNVPTPIDTGSFAQLDGINFFSGPNNIFTGSVLVSGSGQFVNPIPGAFSFDRAIDYGTVNKNNVPYSYGLGFTGMLNYSGASSRYDNALTMFQADSPSFNYYGITYNAGYQVGNIMKTISGSLATNRIETNVDGTTTFRAYGTAVEIGTSNNNEITIGNAGSTQGITIGAQTQVTLGGGSVVINAPATASGDLQVQGNFTSSLQEGYVWVGDASGTTTTVSTGSFGGGGGATFPYTGDAQISGSLGVTGSMSGYVNALSITSNTASVDFTDGNMFTLTLASSAETHINPTNIKAGQTINIQITQPTTSGSVTFAPSVLFAGGADYQATATGSAIDLLTLVSLDGTNVLATSIKNFQ